MWLSGRAGWNSSFFLLDPRLTSSSEAEPILHPRRYMNPIPEPPEPFPEPGPPPIPKPKPEPFPDPPPTNPIPPIPP